jgi:hypothetical protein
MPADSRLSLTMKHFDAIATAIVDTVKRALDHKLPPLEERIQALELRLQHTEAHQVKFMGTFDEQRVYRCNDVVRRAGSAWICTTASAQGEFRHEHWQLLVKKGDAR